MICLKSCKTSIFILRQPVERILLERLNLYLNFCPGHHYCSFVGKHLYRIVWHYFRNYQSTKSWLFTGCCWTFWLIQWERFAGIRFFIAEGSKIGISCSWTLGMASFFVTIIIAGYLTIVYHLIKVMTVHKIVSFLSSFYEISFYIFILLKFPIPQFSNICITFSCSLTTECSFPFW